jgi:hypothetical protein
MRSGSGQDACLMEGTMTVWILYVYLLNEAGGSYMPNSTMALSMLLPAYASENACKAAAAQLPAAAGMTYCLPKQLKE